MTKTQVEVITSVQRRRRWSRAEKERIVAAALEPGVVASEVAREAGIHTSQLFRWRQQLCKRTPAPVAFNPVAVAVQAAPALPFPAPSPEQAGAVEIEFATGGRMRITGSVDSSTVSALLKALAKTKRRRCFQFLPAYECGWRRGTAEVVTLARSWCRKSVSKRTRRR